MSVPEGLRGTGRLEVIEKALDLADHTITITASEKITFLGFEYRLTSSGKVVMTVTSSTVKRKRRKLRHMVAKVKRGEMPKEKADESFRCDLEHLAKGDSHKLIQRYREYYENLWR